MGVLQCGCHDCHEEKNNYCHSLVQKVVKEENYGSFPQEATQVATDGIYAPRTPWAVVGLVVVAHTCDPRTPEAEEGLLQV